MRKMEIKIKNEQGKIGIVIVVLVVVGLLSLVTMPASAELDGGQYQKEVETTLVLTAPTPTSIKTLTSTDWPMFRHDPAHTGQADGEAEPPLELLWKFKPGDGVSSSPAVADGVVYVGSYDDYVYALDADSGEEKWKYETGDSVHSSPAVADGVVYVGSADSYVYALDADSGAEKWKYKTGGWFSSSPAVADGVVYVGSGDYVYALDADSGKEKWKYKKDDWVSSSPVVAGGVVVGSGYDYMYALDADSGAEKWKYKTGGTVRSPVRSPAVADGVVYVCSPDYCVYAFATKSKIELLSTITNAISKAQSEIASANKIGADTAEAQNLLNQAKTALENKQYQEAVNSQTRQKQVLKTQE